MVEQAAAAAESLQEQAEVLAGSVAVFKLAGVQAETAIKRYTNEEKKSPVVSARVIASTPVQLPAQRVALQKPAAEEQRVPLALPKKQLAKQPENQADWEEF